MKFFAAIAALLTLAFAAPTPLENMPRANFINFVLSNDISGAQGVASIIADGKPLRFGTTMVNTPVAKNGRVYASSIQSTTPKPDIFCVVKDPAGKIIGRLNERETYVDLDGNKDKAIEVDVSDFTLACA